MNEKLIANNPRPGERWQHRNGIIYEVLHVTNVAVEREGHPPDVVYRGENGNVWSRPLSDWHRSMTLHTAEQPGSAVQGEADDLDVERQTEIVAALPGTDTTAHRALESLIADLRHQRDDNRRLYRITTPPPAPEPLAFNCANARVGQPGSRCHQWCGDSARCISAGTAAEQGDEATCDCPRDHRGQHIYVCSERPLAFGLHDPAATFNQPEARGVEGIAKALWRRFGDDSRLEWEDEPEKAIYRDTAAQVIALAAAPNPVRAEQEEQDRNA